MLVRFAFLSTLAVPLAMALLAGCTQYGVVQISEFHAQEKPVPETIVVVSWNAQKGGNPAFVTRQRRTIKN